MAIFSRASRLLSAALACALFASPVIATAGTTGGISGTVVDQQSGAPISGAAVAVASPSQGASSTTDAQGHFAFLSLAPDTYSITVDHGGFQRVVLNGVSVFADQMQAVAISMTALKTIANVRSQSPLSPVKPGTTNDVYSVNPAMQQAVAPLGGGGDLNNAYSAIASMPGAYVPPNQSGVAQDVYIRGGNYDQIGYEYDGVPMNRSFDNYPSHSASSLGQQELQIYTGGGPASADATGLAGFINQVVKSGTYPGYGNISMRVGSPAFYHDLSVEAGGASPDRMFSYYAGLSGYNQDFRYLSNQNGANLVNEYPAWYASTVTTNLSFWPAVYPTCNNNDPNNFYDNPAVDNNPALWNDPGCFDAIGANVDLPSTIYGREAVLNLHFGIPHKHNSGRDDVQILYTNSYQLDQSYTSPNDMQPLFNTLIQAGYAYPAMWPDFLTLPAGTTFGQLANVPVVAYPFPGSPTNRCYNTYWTAGGPTVPNECPLTQTGNPDSGTFAPLPNDYRDGESQQASIVKLQYQHNISSGAYLRLFGYTFYSNTADGGAAADGLTGPYGPLYLGGYRTNYDYEVDSHTKGGQLQFADQLSDKHLLTATINYVTSATLRYYNYNDNNYGGAPPNDWTGSSGVAVSNLTNGTQCFAAYDANFSTAMNPDANGVDEYSAGQVAPCNDPVTQGSFDDLSGNADYGPQENVDCTGGANSPIPAAACAAGASWRVTYTGNNTEQNSITPKLANFSLADEWRPNAKLDVNASVRFDRDEFDLTPVDTDPAKNFWYAAAQKEFCYDPVTLQPALIPEPAQYLRDITPYVSFNCPIDPANGVQTVHPDGLDGHILLTDVFNPTYVQSYASPRFGLTYSLDPNNVLRFSAGRFAQEPQNYEMEYNGSYDNLPQQLIGFITYGFDTPFHPAQAQFSNNFDASWEHRLPHSDASFKVTPFYRYGTQQLYETVNVATLSISPSFNSGTERAYGAEFELEMGDFNRNGLTAVLSYTYTNAKEKWSNYANTSINPVDPYNEDIANFNALTKAGGGSPCYTNDRSGTGEDCASDSTAINNPYYNMSPQPLLDKFGWYDTGLDYPYISPNVFAFVLNYKHDKLAITPVLSLSEGTSYGTPSDFQGLDPRTCAQNQGPDGANIPSAPNPQTADYTSCKAAAIGASGSSPGHLYIPNPYTGSFDSFGQFRNPWQMNLGMQVRYDISPTLTANLEATNLLTRCFGGSKEPWTTAFPPSSTVCGYGYNQFYISNYYNGSSPNDIAANGVPLNKFFSVPFVPALTGNDNLNLGYPLELYLQLQFKL